MQNIHAHRILILDFGSQYTQLIARRVRECGTYCEINRMILKKKKLMIFNLKVLFYRVALSLSLKPIFVPQIVCLH